MGQSQCCPISQETVGSTSYMPAQCLAWALRHHGESHQALEGVRLKTHMEDVSSHMCLSALSTSI